jgi:hypothetical protein
VGADGATYLPAVSRRAPSAASRSWGAWAAQTPTPITVVSPDSTAATHRVSTTGSGWRIPRASRGSGTVAKHSGSGAPACARSASARAASTSRLFCARATCLAYADGAGWDPPAGAGRPPPRLAAAAARPLFPPLDGGRARAEAERVLAGSAGMRSWTGNGASRRQVI